MPERSPLVLITGGGTGGHVFPGLAAAAALTARGARVHWLGTRAGMESRLVPAAGIPISFLRVSGVRGKSRWQQLLAPLLLVVAIVHALLVVLKLRPACMLGTGGFVAGPGGIAAWLLRVPVVVHEQNAVAGTTNRLLARFAARILLGLPGPFAEPSARPPCRQPGARGDRRDRGARGAPGRARRAAAPAGDRRQPGRARAERDPARGAGAAADGRASRGLAPGRRARAGRRAASATASAASRRAPRRSSTTWSRPTNGPTSWCAARARSR